MLGGLGSSSLQEESIYLLSPNLHFIKVSANHDRTFVENKTAMESSSFFFCAKSITHVWGVGIKKTMAMENHQTSYKCVHIYMSLQNYCKWSGIYFCSVVCFEKTHHIAALGFQWWLDCHDLCWCCAQVVVVVCGKLYCSWTWGCGAGESVSSAVWTWSGRAASICESLISTPPVTVYGKSLLNQKTPFWIVSSWHSGELIARFYMLLLLPWKNL